MTGSPRWHAARGTSHAIALAALATVLSSAQGPDLPWREDFAGGAWRAIPAAGVQLTAAVERNVAAEPALRLDFDFQGRAGWAAVRRDVALTLPENWELRFRVRGHAPPNHLEVKFIDPSGENVWWSVRRDFVVPAEWTWVRVKKRHVSFAWGPAGGGDLRQLAGLEVAITAGEGGRGRVWLSEIELRPLPPERPYAGTPRLTASLEEPSGPAAHALDARRETAWRAPAAPSELTIEFGQTRVFGGLTLFWDPARAPRRLAIDLREGDDPWREVRRVERGGSPRTDVLLTDAEATALRVRVLDAPAGTALAEIAVRPLAFGASVNAFFEGIAAESPRGTYPRGFSGEQVFWTVAGADGDSEEALVSEDGSVDLGAGAPSLEPFVWMDGELRAWPEFQAGQALLEGDLPVPSVVWDRDGLRVHLTALAAGEAGESALLARYRIQNVGHARRAGRFFLTARPFQVNPPSQFLNRPGGVATLREVRCGAHGLSLDAREVIAAPAPDACGAAAFDEGPIAPWLARGEVPPARSVEEAFPYASGALAWAFDLEPGQHTSIVAGTRFHDAGAPVVEGLAGASAADAAALFDDRLRRVRAAWREKLDRVRFDLPVEASGLAAAVRANLGWILINRDGPAIQPGSRAYERSWIRDGALTSAALLRLGHVEEARAFAEWFSRYQYPDGRVPCCVDRRGADPVPEHDSHGEFIHLVTQVTRHTGDRAFATRMFPHVSRAAAAIDELRRQRRTAEYRDGPKAAYFGLLPESISHEGYSARPVHSYWDSAFAWRGLSDAAWLAAWLGREDDAATYAASARELGADVRASIERVRSRHGIDYVPGSADLGDFDSTSTTVMLDPVGLDALLPREWVTATFERYDREVQARLDGRREWDAYTPYEVRHVGTYVRLGWRDRAHALLRAFLADRRPPGWNQFPEVITREMRKPRFLGDLPHGWVASDFIRSMLDLFAYERRSDGALVLAAGIPADWLTPGRRVAISHLRTPWGPLSYAIDAHPDRLVVRLDALERRPEGGVLLHLPLPPGGKVATVNGRAVRRDADGALRLTELPANVEVTR